MEHTFNDSYWGDGGDGTGKNRLGVLLMDIRDTLKEQQAALEKQKSHRQKVQYWQDSSKRSMGGYAGSNLKRSSSISDISSSKSENPHKLPPLAVKKHHSLSTHPKSFK